MRAQSSKKTSFFSPGLPRLKTPLLSRGYQRQDSGPKSSPPFGIPTAGTAPASLHQRATSIFAAKVRALSLRVLLSKRVVKSALDSTRVQAPEGTTSHAGKPALRMKAAYRLEVNGRRPEVPGDKPRLYWGTQPQLSNNKELDQLRSRPRSHQTLSRVP